MQTDPTDSHAEPAGPAAVLSPDAASTVGAARPSERVACPLRRVAAAQRFWLLLGMVVLIAARSLLIHGDPTDFPLDRNTSSLQRMHLFRDAAAAGDWSPKLLLGLDITPEMPVTPLGGWILSSLTGLPLVTAGRIWSMLGSAVVGLGLYVLGRRIGPPALGILALWLFALDPLAIFMGRVLLPDSWMTAAFVWSLIAAGAGTRDGRIRRAVAMTLLLGFALLAKLPVVLLAPAAALALVQAWGWRRREGWIAAAVAAVVAYAIACAWYRLAPWNPFSGLRRMSEQTNDIFVSMGDLLTDDALTVMGARIVLALTLPGAGVALLGWIALQRRPGIRLWLNAWVLLALLTVGLTLQANSYWAYFLTPVGCLLAAAGVLALAEFGVGGLALGAAVFAFGMLGDPATARVRSYLAVDPDVAVVREQAGPLITGPFAFFGSTIGNEMHYSDQRSTGISEYATHQQQLARLRINQFLLTTNMLGHGLLVDLFEQSPVLATRGHAFVLYGVSNRHRLGEPVLTGTTGTLHLTLGSELIVRGAESSGDAGDLAVSITWEKGEGWQVPPAVTAELVHQASGEAFPVAPLAGGAVFKLWMLPQIQTPDFREAPVERIDYRFEVSESLPAGTYDLRLSLLENRRRSAVRGEPAVIPAVFERMATPGNDGLPHAFDLGRAVWRLPGVVRDADFLGNQRVLWRLGSNSMLWLNAPVPAGDYVLVVRGHGQPVGDASVERWPLLQVQSEQGRKLPEGVVFAGSGTREVRIPIHWLGPQDFLRLRIVNPSEELRTPETFPLYLGETTRGDRAILIESIELHEAGA